MITTPSINHGNGNIFIVRGRGTRRLYFGPVRQFNRAYIGSNIHAREDNFKNTISF